MSRRGWAVFAAVQLVGAVCVWEGPRILTALGPVLFLSGLVLLAPGGLLSVVLVEKLLWNSRLTISGEVPPSSAHGIIRRSNPLSS